MIIILNEFEIAHKTPQDIIDKAEVVLVIGESGNLHLHKHREAPYRMSNAIVSKDDLGHNIMDLGRITTLKIEARQ